MDDSARLKRFLALNVFGTRVPENEDAINRELEALEDKDIQRLEETPKKGRKQSAYIQVFEGMSWKI